jgi:O-acetyl-ADP-ribose deacetylase (regulator of RNase III)
MTSAAAAHFGAIRVELVRGDITAEATDAIVNAANSSLMGGGGVDGAIHRAGGPAILEACRVIRAQRGPLPAGQAVITTGGQLAARYVIHTVGPVWHGGNRGEPALLARCYRNALELASKMRLESLVFPSISTGAYGYPLEQAAFVALDEVLTFLKGHERPTVVVFALFGNDALNAYTAARAKLEAGGR